MVYLCCGGGEDAHHWTPEPVTTVDDMRRCCFWWILDRLLRTDCESHVALLVDALRCILCQVVREAGWTWAEQGDDDTAAGDTADCLVEKLSLLATVEGVAGYGIELGLAILDAAAAAAAAAVLFNEDEDVEPRRPDRLLGFLGTAPALLEDPVESPLAAPAVSPTPEGDATPNGVASPHGVGAPKPSSTLADPPFLDRLLLATGMESPPLDSSELLLLFPFARAGRLDAVVGGDAAFLGLVPNDPLFVRRVPRWLGVLVRDRREGDAPHSSCSDRDEDPRAWGV